ncbi:glucans biosynthesis protein [Rhizomicrobium palustre]|uniref:Glucans biosynthesis protein n=1 Tax=Rhizomicrobium palustre TaxID=189966 RepID=A0A846N4E0_9PROT|nr:glucans biosynthesis protein [Rhizomicrobium palustre]
MKDGLIIGPPHPFSFDRLKKHAKSIAAAAYKPVTRPAPDVVRGINYDVAQKIRFRPDCALFAGLPYPVRMFSLRETVQEPVRISLINGDSARPVLYHPRYFDWGGTGLDKSLPPTAGFSGFRVMNGRDTERDWMAFQGASYFRTSGSEDQYGLSARGLAVNTATATREEFPIFTNFWLSETPDGVITVYALLEGPSLAGAYRIETRKGKGQVMDIHAELFARADIDRLGIAPLTSMFWYSEANHQQAADWRPEIHDSDGLALWTGSGERIYRPLANPPGVQTNSYMDVNPKGFGLIQRDRDFANYEDDGAFYNKRPSVWVEPKGQWGEGAVQLVEINTNDEIHDNIVVYWTPKTKLAAGGSMSLDYRLYWQDPEPFLPKSVAHVVATRIGRGGAPGTQGMPNARRFAIDFEGGPLGDMPPRYDLKPTITLSRGHIAAAYSIKVVGTNRWRAIFDAVFEGKEPVNLRCLIQANGKPLTETWMYQIFP